MEIETDTANRVRTRDHDILRFFWRWKVATVSMVSIHFYGTNATRQGYDRVNALIHMGFVRFQYHAVSERFYVTLTKNGFNELKFEFEHLKEFGYKSEHPNHDLILGAIHYGLYNLDREFFTDVYTEQELRRNEFEFYPAPIPKDGRHRPDGYLITDPKNENPLIAIELELSYKSKYKYASTRNFYLDHQFIKCIWVVESQALAERIFTSIDAGALESRERHKFYLLKDLLRNGWSAKNILAVGDEISLLELFGRDDLNNNPNNDQIMPESIPVCILLNGKKSPHVSATCKNESPSKIHTVIGKHIFIPTSLQMGPDLATSHHSISELDPQKNPKPDEGMV